MHAELTNVRTFASSYKCCAHSSWVPIVEIQLTFILDQGRRFPPELGRVHFHSSISLPFLPFIIIIIIRKDKFILP